MKNDLWIAVAALLLVAATACSSSDGGGADSGADADADTDTDTDADADGGAGGAYAQCDPEDPDCPEGLSCITTLDDPLYGQCTRGCDGNEDCPAPPDPAAMQVACSTTNDTCYILCGAYESVCPEWLECYNLQMCVEPSATEGTGGPGDDCEVIEDCAGAPEEATCVEGESSGMQYCSPLCDSANPTDPACTEGLTDASAQCVAIGAGDAGICMYFCGVMAPGAVCPGDLTCAAGICQ